MTTCRRWRDSMGKSILPRSGTNCFWASIDTFKEYIELVDIFKHSGRLVDAIPFQKQGNIQFGWSLKNFPAKLRRNYTVESFSKIIENSLEPVHLWYPIPELSSDFTINVKEAKEELSVDNIFGTDGIKKLEQRLKTCRNQCYQCHLCERTVGIPDMNSMIEL
jgi:hypothetical protein